MTRREREMALIRAYQGMQPRTHASIRDILDIFPQAWGGYQKTLDVIGEYGGYGLFGEPTSRFRRRIQEAQSPFERAMLSGMLGPETHAIHENPVHGIISRRAAKRVYAAPKPVPKFSTPPPRVEPRAIPKPASVHSREMMDLAKMHRRLKIRRSGL